MPIRSSLALSIVAALILQSAGPGCVSALAQVLETPAGAALPVSDLSITPTAELPAASVESPAAELSGLSLTDSLSSHSLSEAAKLPSQASRAAIPAASRRLVPTSREGAVSFARQSARLGQLRAAENPAPALDGFFTGARSRSDLSGIEAGSDAALPTAIAAMNRLPATVALHAAPEQTPPAPPAQKDSTDSKALAGLFAARTVGILAFLFVTIAYPKAAVPVVGWTGYGVLMAFGPMTSIATGPLNGLMIDKLSMRKAMAINTAARAVFLLALPAFHYFGVLNFGTLLLASMADGWLLSSIMTTEGAFTRRIVSQEKLGPVNSLLYMNYLGLQVFLGLILGVGHYVDGWSPFNVFAMASAMNALCLPLVLLTAPKGSAPKAAAAAGSKASPFAFLGKYWKEAAAFAGSVAAGVAFMSPLPIAASLLFWISRTEGFRNLWNGDARVRNSMLYMALGAMLLYPLQYVGIPHLAEALVGKGSMGLLMGQMLGALFLGNLISTASKANLPEKTLPLLGKIKGQRIVQGVVLALSATWVYTRLVPGSSLAALAAAGAAALLMSLANHLTERGWLKLFAAGTSPIWLPFLAWKGLLPFLSVPSAAFLALVAVGMFYGPTYVSLISYFQSNAKKETLGATMGIQGSFFNAAISIGCGLLTLGSGLLSPAFPGTLAIIAAAFLVGGLLLSRAPNKLPGLPKDLLKK